MNRLLTILCLLLCSTLALSQAAERKGYPGVVTDGARGLKVDGKLSVSSDLTVGTTVVIDGKGVKTNGNYESLGQKLRRLANRAALDNPLIKPPLAAVPDWASGTAYVVGNVVINGGNMYICSGAGTSAGSGGPTGTGLTAITDNTVTWFYYGVPPTASGTAPTVSQSYSATTGLTKRVNVPDYNSSFYFTGGNLNVQDTAGWPGVKYAPMNTVNTDGTNYANQYGAITFYTDAPKFNVEASGGWTYRIIIDGQYVNLNAVKHTGVRIYDLFDFSGVRKTRKVTFECGNGCGLNAVNVDPASSVWAPDSNDKVRVCWVGDSLTSGSTAPAIQDQHVDTQVAKLLGWSDPWNMGIGGTGYWNTVSGTKKNNIQRVADVTANSCDVVVVASGVNDYANRTPTELQADATAYYQALRAGTGGNPYTGPIIVAGLWGAQTGPNASVIAGENAVKAAVTAMNDSSMYFIPISTDTTGAWINGTGKVTAPSGTGNADIFIDSGGTHPNEQGIQFYAQRLATAIRGVIQQIP